MPETKLPMVSQSYSVLPVERSNVHMWPKLLKHFGSGMVKDTLIYREFGMIENSSKGTMAKLRAPFARAPLCRR